MLLPRSLGCDVKRHVIVLRNAELADRDQQEGDEMLDVGEREREAYRLSVSGCALDQQRFAVDSHRVHAIELVMHLAPATSRRGLFF